MEMEGFRSTQKWTRLRRTKQDHHPVHDALGNAEALISGLRRRAVTRRNGVRLRREIAVHG
jgi:hypothetical protein